MLHTVNKSPYQNQTLESCLQHAKEGSALLMIEDAVYGVAKGSPSGEKLERLKEKYQVYALRPDLEARGMDQSNVAAGVKLVDYDGFVDLVVEHGTVQSWL